MFYKSTDRNTMKIKAFSLIEMMLVVLLIAVITIFAVNFMQKQQQNTLAKQTAKTMQSWAEAAKAYHLNNKQWPNSWQDLKSAGLLPDSAQCSNIQLNNSASRCAPYGDFQISISTGNEKTADFIEIQTQAKDAAQAKQIVGLLSGARIDSSNLVVLNVPLNRQHKSISSVTYKTFRTGVQCNIKCIPAPAGQYPYCLSVMKLTLNTTAQNNASPDANSCECQGGPSGDQPECDNE